MEKLLELKERKYQRLDDVATSDDLIDEEDDEVEEIKFSERKLPGRSSPNLINEKKDQENTSSSRSQGISGNSSNSSSTPFSLTDKISLKIISQEKSVTINSLTLSSTITELKEAIASQLNLPIQQQRLIFCGKPLAPDNKSLHEFKIVNESIIHLFPKPSAQTSHNSSSSSSSSSQTNEILNPFHQLASPVIRQLPLQTHNHLPIHFDPEVGQSIREVRMWSYILVIISAMTLISNFSFLGSTGRPGNGVFDGCLNLIEVFCSFAGIYVGQLGLKSSITIDRGTIRKYVFSLSILAVIMIFIRILWVADVVLLAKHDLKERKEDEQDQEEEEEHDEDKGDLYDDYYGDAPEISDQNFLAYFAIQASVMAIIVISMWVTCVMRAYRFRDVVESYEGIASRV